jgi:probable HAF family extracellular repeat protein
MKSRISICITVVTLFAALAIPLGLAVQHNTKQSSKHQNYQFVDLGTFGGPNSYFFHGERFVINSGLAAGFAETSTPDPYAPNCFASDCMLTHTFQWQNGVLTDMGALPGVNNSGPNWMNSSGVITGISENGEIDPATGLPEYDAVNWENGQIINLGTLGGNWSYANALNDSGEVVGFALNTTPDSFNLGNFCENGPFPTQMHATVWTHHVLQDLGTLGGPDSCGLWINQKGQAAGHSFTNSTPNPATGIPTLDPLLWDPNQGKMIDLGTLGGVEGVANGINDRGQVVGSSDVARDASFHAYLWTKPGPMQDLGTFGGNFASAVWLNNAGQVVGWASTAGDQALLAFLWNKGSLTNLGTLSGDDCSIPDYISSGGQIVGMSFSCATGVGRAVLWEKGSLIDLNAFVPPGTNVTLSEATFIDDAGVINVNATLPNGDTHAVLLIPSGENRPGVEGSNYSLVDRPAVVASRPQAPMSQERVSAWTAAHRTNHFYFPGRTVGRAN